MHADGFPATLQRLNLYIKTKSPAQKVPGSLFILKLMLLTHHIAQSMNNAVGCLKIIEQHVR